MVMQAEALSSRLERAEPRLTVALARTEAEVRACQRLRYEVFGLELGARLASAASGLDRDRFDAHCRHLMVQDRNNGKVVATTRVLLHQDAAAAGGFYSETEFDLDGVLAQPGRFMEIGRTCIHAEQRSRAVLSLLWSGLARLVALHEIDYLIGCASLPMHGTGLQARALIERLAARYALPEVWNIQPLVPMPPAPAVLETGMEVPPLLKGYLRLGARVSRAGCWDPDFDVVDLFVLLNRDNLEQRYARHFLGEV